jgi:cardiolipin synthase
VAVQWFMPLLHNPLRGRTNLRNHRKLVVADASLLWAGGRNLAAEYFVDRPGRPAWMDLSFTVHGPLAAHAQSLFDHDWSIASGRGPRGAAAASTTAGTGQPLPRAETELTDARKPGGDVDAVAQIIASGPDLADDTVYALLVSAAYQARKRIRIATPYFVPDDALLSALCLACRRGVRVTVLIPARSNHRLADIARERSVRQLVQAGGEVLLDPGMMHAKAIVVDDRLALCGTANLDTRSLLLNFEVMVAFYGAGEIAWLDAWISRRADGASAADARLPGWWRDVLEGMVRAVGYQL